MNGGSIKWHQYWPNPIRAVEFNKRTAKDSLTTNKKKQSYMNTSPWAIHTFLKKKVTNSKFRGKKFMNSFYWVCNLEKEYSIVWKILSELPIKIPTICLTQTMILLPFSTCLCGLRMTPRFIVHFGKQKSLQHNRFSLREPRN